MTKGSDAAETRLTVPHITLGLFEDRSTATAVGVNESASARDGSNRNSPSLLHNPEDEAMEDAPAPTATQQWRSRVAPSEEEDNGGSTFATGHAQGNDNSAMSALVHPPPPSQGTTTMRQRQRARPGVHFADAEGESSDDDAGPDVYGDGYYLPAKVTPRFATTAVFSPRATAMATVPRHALDLVDGRTGRMDTRNVRMADVANSLTPESTRKPYSPSAAANDDQFEATLEDAFDDDDDADVEQGTGMGFTYNRTMRPQDEDSKKAISTTRKKLLAKFSKRAQRLDMFDIALILVTERYPVRRIMRCMARNKFLKELMAQEAPVDSAEVQKLLTESTPRKQVAGYDANVVVFDAKFDKPYVSRLTTKLERHEVQQMEEYKTLAREKPLRALPVRERFWAALHRQTANNPNRKLLHGAAYTMLTSAQGDDVSFGELFRARAIIGLQWTFHFFTPKRLRLKKRAAYTPWHTYALMLITITVYAFMAGEYPYWLEHTGQSPQVPDAAPLVGPRALWRWVTENGQLWRSFDGYYLIRWGALYPGLTDESRRWFVATLVHADFMHILSNTVMFVALATYLECKCGTWRAATAFWLTALGGGFVALAAAAGSECAATVGSSGGVFGLLGVFIADVLLNFSSVAYPAYRMFAVLLFGIMWAASSSKGSSEGVSHMSHVTGVLYGFCIGSLYLPSLPHELLETFVPLMVLLVSFLVFLVPLMTGVLTPSTSCPEPSDLLNMLTCDRNWQ